MHQWSFYNWDDVKYRAFIMETMYSLEPIKVGSKQVLFNELEDVN